jgi:hypothetical protein
MNVKKELEKNIRWIALKSGKTNKQVMDDIKKFEKIIFGDNVLFDLCSISLIYYQYFLFFVGLCCGTVILIVVCWCCENVSSFFKLL